MDLICWWHKLWGGMGLAT